MGNAAQVRKKNKTYACTRTLPFPPPTNGKNKRSSVGKNTSYSDLISWKERVRAPIGKRRMALQMTEIGIKTQRVTQHPADEHGREKTRAKACVVAFALPPASVWFGRTQARKLSLSGSLGWTEGESYNSTGGTGMKTQLSKSSA